MKLHLEQGGDGTRCCILLHGLGANAEVWRPLIAHVEAEGGWRWFAPDLRGHGRSAWGDDYAPSRLAADVVDTIGARIESAVVLGHSLGGVVALELAAATPSVVFGLGIKVDWTPAELERGRELAGRPARTFETREAAIDRHLKVAGLHGRVSLDEPVAQVGVTGCEGGWRLAMDPAANGVSPPDMGYLTAASQRPIHLARGAQDPIVSLASLRAHDPAAEDLAGAGHNAMVEAPDQVWRWVRSWTS